MILSIELTKEDLKKLIIDHLRTRLEHEFDGNKISILVKSKQNYKSEWEPADFKAIYKDM